MLNFFKTNKYWLELLDMLWPIIKVSVAFLALGGFLALLHWITKAVYG